MQGDNQQSRLADADFIHRLMREPLLSKEGEQDLAFAWRESRDEKALHQLIRSFSRLVVSVALRFRYYGVSIADIIQEGNIGLIIAADKFDPTREVRFSTYAKWWIRATIQDYILKNWSIVRSSSTTAQKQLFFNLKRLKTALQNLDESEMSFEDRESIAKSLKVTLRDVEEMEIRLTGGYDLSLSTPVGESLTVDWQEFLPDERPNPEKQSTQTNDQSWRKHWLDFALQDLDDREKTVIEMRRLTESPLTLEDVGKNLKISKERVRQIEGRAMRKMRHSLIHHMHAVRELL